jgi:hypothetical protein
MHAKFWFESLKVRNSLEDVGVDGKIILEMILARICELNVSGSV